MTMRALVLAIVLAISIAPVAVSARSCLPTLTQLTTMRAEAEARGKGAKVVPQRVLSGEGLRPPKTMPVQAEQRAPVVQLPCKDEDLRSSQ